MRSYIMENFLRIWGLVLKMLELSKQFYEKSPEENKYTSTGIKFWRHPNAMKAYKNGAPQSIISTHIAPEGHCNLSCSYCSVSKRKVNERIELDTIKNYVLTLKKYGLKAVILTGGGEPTLYPKFNELIRWLVEQHLSIALITNGTNTDKVDSELWDYFSWVRISINFFRNYQKVIKFPYIKGVLGASMVYIGQTVEEINKLSAFIPTDRVQYIRVLPNCLHEQENLLEEHNKISEILKQVNDKRFFQQFKIHETPRTTICHQAYFRPYLSEVNGGTVFPCDSLVLNEAQAHFNEKYAICPAADIEKFLKRTVKMDFNPKEDCQGCVFARNINLLDDWVCNGTNHFDEYKEALTHEEFV